MSREIDHMPKDTLQHAYFKNFSGRNDVTPAPSKGVLDVNNVPSKESQDDNLVPFKEKNDVISGHSNSNEKIYIIPGPSKEAAFSIYP